MYTFHDDSDEPHKLSIHEFFKSPLRNAYIHFTAKNGNEYTSYIRKSQRLIDGVVYSAIDRANTSCLTKIPSWGNPEDTMSHGKGYKELDEALCLHAKNFGFQVLYVENVLNPVLHTVLIKEQYGYKRIPEKTKNIYEWETSVPCYYKILT